MKQLYKVKLRGNGRIIESFVFTDMKDKSAAAKKVMDDNNVPIRERYKYRFADIKLMMPESWIRIEDNGTEVN